MARPRDPEISQRVVDACVELLGEVGRAGLTRAAVARRAGVSLPAVHRRFADVDEILLAVATSTHERVRDLEPGPTPPTLRAWLMAGLNRTVDVMAAEPRLRREAAELLAAASGNTQLDAVFGASLATERTEGLAVVERARESGEIRADVDAEALLDLAAAAAYYRLLWRGQILEPGDVDSVVDLVMSGAAPR